MPVLANLGTPRKVYSRKTPCGATEGAIFCFATNITTTTTIYLFKVDKHLQ